MGTQGPMVSSWFCGLMMGVSQFSENSEEQGDKLPFRYAQSQLNRIPKKRRLIHRIGQLKAKLAKLRKELITPSGGGGGGGSECFSTYTSHN